MNKLLKKLHKEQQLAAFFTNRNESDRFSVGYVYAISNETIIIQCVGLHGEFDGYTVVYINNIYKIEVDSIYLNKITRLLTCNQQRELTDITDNLFLDLLKIAKRDMRVVSVFIFDCDMDVTGYIDDIFDTTISIKQLNSEGKYDGISTVCLEDIIRIDMDDCECRDLEKLSDVRLK